MASTSVVRMGPFHDNVSAKVLQAAVVSHFQNLNPAASSPQEGNGDAADEVAGDNSAETIDATITISNKYFDAKILFHGLQEELNEDIRPKSTEDGMILCFPALESNPDMGAVSNVTFDSLDAVHQKASALNTCGETLRLCVGVSFDDLSPSEIRGKDHEGEYSRRIMWCLDHGYEYVEANLSAEGQAKGHDDRDKEGFARIIEAIQGTVWASAVMRKTRKASTMHASTTTAAPSGENTAQSNQDQHHQQQQQEKNQGQGQQAEEKEEKKTAKSEEASSQADAKMVAPPTVKQSFNESKTEGEDEDEDSEKLFDQMDRLLQEASQIRDASRAGAISDDERRERAGDAAMSLMNLMNQLGMDDDDDADVSDSDDDNSLQGS